MRRLFLVPLLCALASAPALGAVTEPGRGDDLVIPPGQEELLGEIVGRGGTFPGGCALASGQVEHTTVVGRYECSNGEVVLELRHPSSVAAGSWRTERFAIVVRSGSPPPGFLEALRPWIESHEAAFEWRRLPTPVPPLPAPSAPSAALPVLAALLVLAALAFVLPRLTRRLRERWRSRRTRVSRDGWFWAGVVVLAVSSVLRCWLAVINGQQNDNHLEVAAMIAKSGWAAPASATCMECSHPKLYHYALALASDLIPLRDMAVGNLLNAVSASILLVLFFVFSRHGPWTPPVRLLGFAFISFNAGLIGISIQATNDLFCILFSSLAIFYLDRFLAARRLTTAVASTLCMILAALSKASGWAIFACGAAVLCLTTLASPPRMKAKCAMATGVFVLGFLCIVSLMNPYRDNILQRGTPFVNDAFDLPVMRLEVPRPTTWVWQSFFTFRPFELLRVPFNEYGPPPYPLHRESLWSQLHGRTFFLRFDQNIWQNQDPRLLNLGRLCLVLGLLPLAALLLGIARLLRSAWGGVSARGLPWFAEDHQWHHIVYVGVLLAAQIALLVTYHRLAIMFMWTKAFYLFPALLPLFKLFLDGLELLWRRSPRLVAVGMSALVAASIADIGWLIRDLSIVAPQ